MESLTIGQLAQHSGVGVETVRFYEREGLTTVFWQEGPVVCVLVSDTDAETVIQLAFDKAMAAVTAL